MQFQNVRAALAALSLCGATAAQAAAPTLIGDTLDFLRAYPDTSTQYLNSIPSTTVAAGPSDQVSWTIFGSLVVTVFDPEADRITFSFPIAAGFGGANHPIFDGFVVSGFDHDIASVALLSAEGYDNFAVNLTHDLRSIAVDISQTNNRPANFVIGVTLADSTPPIPEPATSALAAAGLGVLALMARRRTRARA